MEQKQQSDLQLPQLHCKNFLNGYLLVKNVTSVLKRLLPRRRYFFVYDEEQECLLYYNSRLEWLKRVQPLGVIINNGSALPACESQPTTLCLRDSSGARYELTAETKAEMLAWCFMLQGIYKHGLGVFAKLNGARAQSLKQSHSCAQLCRNVRRLYSLPASGMKAASSLDFDSNFEHFCRNCKTPEMMTGDNMEKLLHSFQKVKLSNGSICKSTGSTNSSIQSAYNTASVVDVLKSLVVEETHEGCFEVVSLLLQVINKLEKDPNHCNFHAELDNCFIDEVKLPHQRKKSSGRLRKHLQKKDHQIKVHCRILRKFTEELFDYKKAYVRCLLNSVRVHADDMSSFSEISFPIPSDETEYERIEKLANEAKHQDSSVATMEQMMSNRGFTDRYGFQHKTNDEQTAAIYVASCLQQHYTTLSQKSDELVWKKLIAVFNENGFLHTQDLRGVIRNGVPHKYRSIVWSILLSSKTDKLKEKYGLHYFRRLSCIIDTAETSERQDHNRRQIGLDLLRTLPNNVYFNSVNAKGVVQMQRVLSAFCVHNPKLGYCQGMNFVVATSLLFFSPEDSFWFLIALTECYFPKDHYDSLLVGVRAAQAVLRDILRQKLPSLSAHFDLCDFDISVVTLNWFIALFYDALPFDVMLRVWDCFLLEGQKVIYRFAVALFHLHRKEIVAQKDSLSLIRFLKSTVRNTYDVETLTKVAYQTLKPFPKRKELLRCHLHHVMSVKQQTFRLYKLRIEAMRQKNIEKCNLLQCHHVLANVSIPNTETILISFGCNENSRFGLINSRNYQFSILPGKVADRILCMTTSNGDIFFASTLSASLFAFRLNKNFQSWQTLWEITIQDVILDMVARGSTIYAALSNGSLAFIQNSGDTADCADFLNHFYIRISDASPIHRLLLVDNHLWLALGDQIVVYDAGTLDKVEQVKMASSTTSLGRIARMELSRFGIWVYQEHSNTVELWDPRFFTRILSFQVEEYASEPNSQFVSSMCCVEDTLWIGTRVGLLLVYKLEEHDHPADQLYRFRSCDSCFNQGLIFCYSPQDDCRAMLTHRDSGYCEGVAHQLSSDPCISGNDWEQLQNEQRQEMISGCDWKYFGSLDRRQWALKRIINEQHNCNQSSRRRRMHFGHAVPILPKVKEKHPVYFASSLSSSSSSSSSPSASASASSRLQAITTSNHTSKDNNSINKSTLCTATVAASSAVAPIGKDNNLNDEWKLTLDESTTAAIALPMHTRSLLQIAGDRLNKHSYLALSSSLESLKQRNTPNTGSCLSVLSQMQSVGKQKTLFSFFGKLTPGSSKSADPSSEKTAKEQKAVSNEEKNCTNEESPIKMLKNGQKRRLVIIESDSECESEKNIAKPNEPANEQGSPVSPVFPISKRARLSVSGLDNLTTSTPKSCEKTLEKFCYRSTISDQSIEVTSNEKHETSECRFESTFEESSYLNEKDNSYFSSFVADDSFLKESTQQRFKHLDFEFLKPEKIRDSNRRRPDDADYDARTLFVPESFLKEQTPAHRQWWLMKSKHFDTILFFKVGKFYELYHMDAVVGVKNLNLSFMKGDYAHCGFPEVSFDRFSDQLIEHGFKVARVEQTETPEMLQKRAHQELLSSKDKVIRREICRIITRGTKTYNFLETEDDNVQVSYLAALCEQNSTDKKNQIGICFVNTSVGKISISQFEDDCDYSLLRTLFASYPPVQILFPRGQLSQQMLNMFKYNLNNVDKEALIPKVQFWTAADTIRHLSLDCYFGVDDQGNVNWPEALATCIDQQDLFQQTPKPQYALGISSFGAVIWYLKECLIDHDILRLKNVELYSPPTTMQIAKLASCHQPLKNRYMVLDDITLRNLDIVNFERKKSTKVTLYDEINLCKTAMGKRLLHFWLCNPLCDLQEIEQRQTAVRNLIEQTELFESLIKQLREIPDLERLLQKMHSLSIKAPNTDHPECRAVYFEADTYSKRKVADFVQLISGFSKANKLMHTVCNFASEIHSSLLQMLFIRKGGGKCFPDIESDVQYFQNAFDHETAKTIGSIIPEKGVDPALDAANQTIVHAEQQLEKYLKTIQKRLNCSSVQYLSSGRNRYNLEIPESACKNLNHEFDFRSQRKGFKRYTTKELDELVKLLTASEADREVALKDIMRRLFASFCERKVKWYAAVENIATLDVLLAFAQYAKCSTREVCCPKFVDAIDGKTFLRLDESVHPCCGKIKTQGDYIANDVLIGSSESDTGQVLLLTGANMGGKSTLMRQVGTLVVLAQIGSYVPARNFTLSPVDRIFTRIGARDSLITGQSTLFVELRETSAILKHATVHSFVIIDELGRGTSTWDGTAIAYATLQYITNHIGCRTIFSTHYHSLIDSLAANPRIRLGHMACMVENESERADPTEENVVFLYKLAPGACPKSYGFNAAKLAGIHADV